MTTRWSINIGPVERVGRIVVGGIGVLLGALLLAGGTSTGVVLLATVLIVAGLDLVVTGATGHCPLYQRLGHIPKSLQVKEGRHETRTISHR